MADAGGVGRRQGGADRRLRAALAKARAEAPPDEPARGRSRTPPRRGGGGARHRLAAQLGKADDTKAPKNTVGDIFQVMLGRLMLANKVSAVDTQAVAHAAQEAGATGVLGLSKAGNYGRTLQNAHRDAQRQLLKGVTVPEPYYAEVCHTSASVKRQ